MRAARLGAASAGGLEFVATEVGLEAAKGHDYRQGWADRFALPVVKNLLDLARLPLQIEGLAAVFRVVEHNHTGADPDLISRLLERSTLQ